MSHTTAGGSPLRTVAPDSDLAVRASDGTTVVIRSRARPPTFAASFTRRQSEILALVADGLSNAEIAQALGISRRTVEKHLETIHAKAGTATRARLVAFARNAIRLDEP
ncbi:MAG TPA: helix-turn-helix transcriptional regulator [Actinomycetota bacterium]|nr:helix-turn-helix transcriptional regulator [Actinomycetota bacterium]